MAFTTKTPAPDEIRFDLSKDLISVPPPYWDKAVWGRRPIRMPIKCYIHPEDSERVELCSGFIPHCNYPQPDFENNPDEIGTIGVRNLLAFRVFLKKD